MTGKSIRILTVTLAFLGVLFVLQPAAMADQMTLTGVDHGYVMGNVYVDPYQANIGTQTNVLVICDDFTDDTWVGESWTANVSTVSSLVNQKFTTGQGSSVQQDYDAAAWLSEQLLSPTTAVTSVFTNYTTSADFAELQGDISYAIWTIFDQPAIYGYGGSSTSSTVSGTDQTYINELRTTALTQTYSPGQFSNVEVYTPVSGTATNCGEVGVACPANSPQEFLVVTTPEASSLANLAVDLLLLVGAVFVVRRRRLPSGLSN